MRKKLLLMLMAIVSPLVALAADGDEFEVANDDYALHYQVISEDDKTAMLSWFEVKNGDWTGPITIPEEVVNGSSAYKVIWITGFGYSGATSITIPKTVTSLGFWGDCDNCSGSNPFSDCPNLTSIAIEDGNPRYKIEGNFLIDTYTKALVAGFGNGTIPAGTTRIVAGAFQNCLALTEIVIPESVKVIEGNAFANCQNLTSVTLPESLEELGGAAFYHTSISSIEIPATLKYIQGDTFKDTKLTEVIIPKNIKNIDGWAFGNDPITKVTSYVVEPFDIYGVFNNDETGALIPTTLEVPMGTKSLYQEKEGWNEFPTITEIDVPSNPVAGDYLTYNIDEQTRLIFTITSVKNKTCKLARLSGYTDSDGEYYENNYPLLGADPSEQISLVIPDDVDGYKVTEIAESAFYDAGLGSVELPATIESIDAFAFGWGLKTLKSNIPTAISINKNAFYDYLTTATLYVPIGTKEAYKAAEVWKEFQYIFAGNEGTNFTAKTAEGIEMAFTITEDGKECQVGYAEAEAYTDKLAIDKKTEGKVTIPEKVTFDSVEYSVTAIGEYNQEIKGKTNVEIIPVSA